MTGAAARLDPGVRSDRPVRFLIVGLAVLLLALAGGSASNYSSFVVAQATVSIVPTTNLALHGTNLDGTLTPEGSVTITLDLLVDNPSSRVLRLRLLAFSEWVEDGPALAGLNESRRIQDDRLVDENGTRYFYRAFGESTEVAGDTIDACSRASFAFMYTLTNASNSIRFGVVRNITDYWASTKGEATAGTWISWVRVQLAIEGVPVASSPSAAAYVFALGTIERREGINLAAPP